MCKFKGSSAGFLRVLNSKTITYADFSGNVQDNDRVSIFLMDYHATVERAALRAALNRHTPS